MESKILSKSTSLKDFKGQTSPKSLNKSSHMSEDVKFQIFMSNKLFLHEFTKYLIEEELAVENIVFYIGVQLFLACQDGPTKCALASYLYKAFLGAKAPFNINVSDEIKRKIQIPTILLSSLNKTPSTVLAFYADNELDLQMFQESSKRVFVSLKNRYFPKFVQSEQFKNYQNPSEKDIALYRSSFIKRTYWESFHPTLTSIMRILDILDTDPAKEYNEETDGSFEAFMDTYKDRLLHKIVKLLFADLSITKYASVLRHLKQEEKTIKAEKQKRILKFFGDSNAGERALLIPTVVSAKNFEDDDEVDVPELSKKKTKKLQGFFGANIRENSLSKRSRNASISGRKASIVSPKSPSRQSSVKSGRSLSSSGPSRTVTKSELKKRSKKLQKLLGERLDTSLIQNTHPNPHVESPESARSPSFSSPLDDIPESEHLNQVDKMSKLSNLLGEPIPAEKLIAAPNVRRMSSKKRISQEIASINPELASRVRTANIKRNQKLGKMLGEALPPLANESEISKAALDKLEQDLGIYEGIVSVDHRRQTLSHFETLLGSKMDDEELLKLVDENQVELKIEQQLNQLIQFKKDILGLRMRVSIQKSLN